MMISDKCKWHYDLALRGLGFREEMKLGRLNKGKAR